jgi:hypothetical protein
MFMHTVERGQHYTTTASSRYTGKLLAKTKSGRCPDSADPTRMFGILNIRFKEIY